MTYSRSGIPERLFLYKKSHYHAHGNDSVRRILRPLNMNRYMIDNEIMFSRPKGERTTLFFIKKTPYLRTEWEDISLVGDLSGKITIVFRGDSSSYILICNNIV